MARARELSLRSFDPEGIGLAVIAPNDPAAMDAYAKECRDLGIPFLYDPSQQVARLSARISSSASTAPSILIGNEYEFGIVERRPASPRPRSSLASRSSSSRGERKARRSPFGAARSRSRTARDAPDSAGAAARAGRRPTGVGDAFRAGLLAARKKGLPWEVAGRSGSVAAVFALETLGPQPAPYSRAEFVARYRENFGTDGIHSEIGRLSGP